MDVTILKDKVFLLYLYNNPQQQSQMHLLLSSLNVADFEKAKLTKDCSFMKKHDSWGNCKLCFGPSSARLSSALALSSEPRNRPVLPHSPSWSAV